ncbi:hypothetical protein AGMMS49579_07890 [Spirochaetia bacterium]|nr:hypothetical protein AGMMS49579_07890 [Spirochaetia bacterium]
MFRIEIVANHSVEENILEAFVQENVGKFYTKYPNVFGVGTTGPRMGDAIWPEVNFSLVIWCEEEEAHGIERAVARVKEHFPDEGIKIFGLPEHLPQVVAIPAAVVPMAAAPAATVAASPAYQPPVYEPPAPAPDPTIVKEYDGQRMDG